MSWHSSPHGFYRWCGDDPAGIKFGVVTNSVGANRISFARRNGIAYSQPWTSWTCYASKAELHVIERELHATLRRRLTLHNMLSREYYMPCAKLGMAGTVRLIDKVIADAVKAHNEARIDAGTRRRA